MGLAVITFLVLVSAPLALPSFARPPTRRDRTVAPPRPRRHGRPAVLALSSASPTTQRWFAPRWGRAVPAVRGLEPRQSHRPRRLPGPGGAEPRSPRAGALVVDRLRAVRPRDRRRSGIVSRKGRLLEPAEEAAAITPTAARRVWWVVLAAIPAALLIGVTTDISTDIAAVPLLWVGPLVVYLATLILAYARADPIGRRAAALVLVPLALVVALRARGHRAADRGLHRGPARDARCRGPGAARTAGGRPTGTDAPHRVHAARRARRRPRRHRGRHRGAARVPRPARGAPRARGRRRARDASGRWRIVSMPVVVALGLAVAATVVGPPGTIRVDRSFWRVPGRRADARSPRAVFGDDDPRARELRRPVCGRAPQLLPPGEAAGRGDRVDAGRRPDHADRRGRVEGLRSPPMDGPGTASTSSRSTRRSCRSPGTSSFTFLADSPARVDVDVEDGRLGLESTPDGAFDLLVLDAFSSDAVPVHLLTVESLDGDADGRPAGSSPSTSRTDSSTWSRSSRPRREANGFVSIVGSDSPTAELTDLADPSQWVVVGRSYADLADLVAGDRWQTAHADGRRRGRTATAT